MPSCMECRRGFHFTCLGDCDCSHADVEDTFDESESSDDSSQSDNDGPITASNSTGRLRRNKPDSAIKDQQSTGRKRAAKLYPLDELAPCEWRDTFAAGGGTQPIFGCKAEENKLQQARHHGPDKNTLNNEPGNVHRICHQCHNRWHSGNDDDYDPNKPLKD